MEALDLLVVEDEATYLYILAEILSSAGHNVHQALGGQEALNVLKSKKIDVIFTDHRMQPMSGLEMIHTIRSEQEIQHIPIIVISGDDSMDTIMKAAEEKVDGYIVKPFDARAVLNKLELVASLSPHRISNTKRSE